MYILIIYDALLESVSSHGWDWLQRLYWFALLASVALACVLHRSALFPFVAVFALGHGVCETLYIYIERDH